MSDSGFIKIHRTLWSSDDFDPEPFTQRESFLWLVSNAAWKPCKVRYGPHTYHLERGDYVSSIRRLGEQWGWHRNKVDRFLNSLVKRGVLKIRTPHKGGAGHITICNYCKYQDVRDNSGTPTGTGTGHLRDTSGTHKEESKKLRREEEDLESKDSIDHFFETEFWPAYPKKVGKGDALKALKAAAKRSSTGEIIVGLRRACDHWRAVGTEMQFIPNPGTWLRADRWKDEQPPCGPVNGGNGSARGSPQKLGRAERVAIAMAERERRKQENEQRGFNL